MTSTEVRRPGRPRSRSLDEVILATTLDVLRETGYGGLTVSAVIERARVSSATLYRRWGTKQQLVAAALASLVPDPISTDTGSLAGDLAAFLEHLARSMTARRDSFERLTAELWGDTELEAALRDKFLLPRVAELDGILDRACGRGELAAAVPTEEALSLVVGPLYHRAFALREPLTARFVGRAARVALAGLAALAGGDAGD